MENLKSEKDLLANLERLRKEKNYNDLFAFAEKSLANFPESFPLKLLYAEALAENGKLNEADNILKELMLTYPDNIKLLLEKGKIDFGLAGYNEAAESFNKILFLDPYNHPAKEWLVKIDKLINVKPAGGETAKTPIMGAPAAKPVRTLTGAQIPPAVPPPIPHGETGKMPEPAGPGPGREPTTIERREVDTTPYTGQTKPEIKTKKPDLDTKKVVFMPPAGGKAAQPPPIPQPKKIIGEPTGLEFDLPLPTRPAKLLFTSQAISSPKMAEDTKKVPFITGQPPTLSEDEFDIPALQRTGDDTPPIEFDIPGLDLSDTVPPISSAAVAQKPSIDTKKVPIIPKPQPPPIKLRKEFGIPTIVETTREKIEIEYEIPDQESNPAWSNFAADTLVEMDIPPIPKMEQGPPIPPPTMSAHGHGLEDEIPSIHEEYPQDIEIETEYEIPTGETFPRAEPEEEFDITASMQSDEDEVEIEYEVPTQGAFSGGEDEFEIDASMPAADFEEEGREYVIPPAPAADREAEEDFETLPDPTQAEPKPGETISAPQPDTQYALKQPRSAAAPGKEEAGKKEEAGGRTYEETEFMTESAAELYLSQGLFDDALTIYEKLYRARKGEKYLMKIRQISTKRIAQKKIQALTRMLMLIEKKGEHRV